MKVSELNNINLPSKKEEEYLKVDFEKLYKKDFKNIEKYQLDIMGLEIYLDERNYDSKLFEVVKTLDNETKVLKITSNTPEPIFLVHKLTEDDTLFINNLEILVESNVKAQVVEVFATNTASSYSVLRNISIGENTEFEYVKVQDYSSDASLNYNVKINQGQNSKLNFTNFEYGDGLAINQYENIITNESCEYNLNALIKLNNNANCSNLIKTLHDNSDSTSNINFKHTLKDSAKAVFKARSIVSEKGNNSKAFQNSNTILLSNDAEIFAQPHLEIKIDELEASHGTTTGTLDKEQLLYLQSRGISEEKAYDMLLNAFEQQIYSCVENEDIKEFLANYKREKHV